MSDLSEWAQVEPRALARHVRPQDIPAEFSLPPYINRLDLLQAAGPQGLAGELYQRIARLGLNYDRAPISSHSGAVQRVRTPALILKEGRGTCLDLAVAFATACLANDLLSFIVILEGHALAGLSVTRTRLQPGRPPAALAWDRGLLSDLEVARSWTGSEALWVECTGLARSTSLDTQLPEERGREVAGTQSFERACAVGAEQMFQAFSGDATPAADSRRFMYVLDLHDLQIQYGFEPNSFPDSGVATGGVSLHSSGNVSIGGDIVGRDKITTLTGDTIHVGNISGSSGIAIGRGARASVTTGATAGDLSTAFAAVYHAIQTRPADPQFDKDEITEAVQRIERESDKGAAAEAVKLERWVRNIAGIAPDILEVMVAGLSGTADVAGARIKKVIEQTRTSGA